MWLEGLSGDGVLRAHHAGSSTSRSSASTRAVGLYVELNYLRNRRMLRSGP